MKCNHKQAGLALALASTLTLSTAAWAGGDYKAEDPSFRELSAQWWQWALSIPAPVNPLAEFTDDGSVCMVGQRGSVWFLAGTLVGGTVSRKCSVPAGTAIFFPVVNSMQVNTPGVCGQGPNEVLTVADMRVNVAKFIDGVTQMTATLDGKAIKAMRRVRSEPFAAALPALAAAAEDHTAIYVKLEGLKPGPHTLQFTALNPSAGFDLNISYQLNVVPVSKR